MVVASATISFAGAAPPYERPPAEQTIVTGSLFNRTLGETSEATTIITGQEIRLYQYQTLRDALQTVPGLHVSVTGGAGAQTSVFSRGAESNHVLVLIDGVKVNDPASDSLFEFSHLPLYQVERIEVTRGGQSAQYGSDALGGVIHIITNRASGKQHIAIERGSFNHRAVAASISTKGQVDASLSAYYRKTDGESATPARLRAGMSGDADGYRNGDVRLNLGLDLMSDVHLELMAAYNENEVEYDGFLGEDMQLELRTDSKLAAIRLRSTRFSQWQPVLSIDRYAKDTRTGGSDSRGERTHAVWTNTLRLSAQTSVVLGADTALEKIRFDGTAHRARDQKVYAEWQYLPHRDWTLSYSWAHNDPEDYSSTRSWRLGAVWRPDWHDDYDLLIRADYATGYRAPTLSERFRDFPLFNFYGNPDLEPETNRHWQLGFEQGAGQWRIGASYFNNAIRNLIEFAATSTMRNTLLNKGSASIEGIEGFISRRDPRYLSWRIDYTGMRAFSADRQRLLRRPLRKVSLRLFRKVWEGFDLAWRTQYVGKRYDIDRINGQSGKPLGGYAVSYATVRKQIGRGSLFAAMDNVFAKRFEPVDGFAGQGRALRIGYETNF